MTPGYYYFSSQFISYFVKYGQMHTNEFKVGSEFLKILTSDNEEKILNFQGFRIVYKYGGVFFIDNSENNLHGFVLDIDNIKDRNLFDANILRIIEKYFRLYIKLDNNYPLANNEIHINGSDNYIVNPFQYISGKFMKYIITTSPEPKRDRIRNIKLYLNITDGTGNLDTEKYSKKNYHKVKDKFNEIISLSNKYISPGAENTSNRLSLFIDIAKEQFVDEVSNYIGFENWKNHLTTTQMDFIFNESLGPSRICGPAGCGKTLSLILKSIYLSRVYSEKGKSLKIGFICHSEAMKNTIKSILEIDAASYLNSTEGVSIEVVTLLNWCIDYAVKDFSLDDCLEVDSADTKLMQEIMIDAALKKFMDTEYKTYEPYLSKKFTNFLQQNEKQRVIESIRNEISIYIKGANIESVEEYKKTAVKNKIIPFEKDEDLSALYHIYDLYQRSLSETNKYDIDDVSSVALGYLTKTIWKRNREILGYDVIIIDELHLYDFAEICLLRYMLKEHDSNHIICAVDVSQSTSDISITEKNIDIFEKTGVNDSSLNIIFRSSIDIVNLTHYLFDLNVSLFSKSNPIANTEVFSHEKYYGKPQVIKTINDMELINKVISTKEFNSHDRSNNLIIVTDYILLDMLAEALEKTNIAYICITKRNDIELIRRAKKDNKLIIGYIDFIGGLEFDSVHILGLDKNRVPPNNDAVSFEFFAHIWYRKLYVAFTRARKRLIIYTNINSGLHDFIEASINAQLLEVI